MCSQGLGCARPARHPVNPDSPGPWPLGHYLSFSRRSAGAITGSFAWCNPTFSKASMAAGSAQSFSRPSVAPVRDVAFLFYLPLQINSGELTERHANRLHLLLVVSGCVHSSATSYLMTYPS